MNNPLHTLRTLTRVTEIRKAGDGYDILQEHVRTGQRRRTHAKKVVLASGVLGTAELLLRSRGNLTLSRTLGSRFSTNGDFSGFVVDVPKVLGGADNRVFPTRGPINTSHAMFQDGDVYMNVEDAGIPAMFASVTRATVDILKRAQPGSPLLGQFVGAMSKLWFKRQFPDLFPHASDPRAFETDAETISNVFWFNCMGNDQTFGTFDLDRHGHLTLDYPDPSNNPLFTKTREVMSKLGDAMGGKYVDFPMWSKDLFGTRKLVVTHPLGGCPIGRSGSEGTADLQGRVFTGSNGTDVHPGLYVADGSLMPGPIGVNPTLTIVAVALQVARGIAASL
jgi:cholesterol oxidase